MEETIFLSESEQSSDITDDALDTETDTQNQNEDEHRREYEELIRTKYKKFYTEDTQKMINRRFRKYKELEARAEQLEKEKAQFEQRLADETEKSAREAEQRLISGIRARYSRPEENGILTAKVPSKRDVASLTRSQRADMAMRASKGETIKI